MSIPTIPSIGDFVHPFSWRVTLGGRLSRNGKSVLWVVAHKDSSFLEGNVSDDLLRDKMHITHLQ